RYSKWLVAFAKRHPKAKIVTHTGTIEDVIKLIREREVAVGFFLSSGPVEGIRSEVLEHEPRLLVVSPRHPLATRTRVSPEEIARHPFVTGLRGSRFFELTDAALRQIGIAAYEIAMELQDAMAVKEMVRHGAGIACVPARTVRGEIAAGLLVPLKLGTELPALEIRYGHLALLSGVARQFVAAIRGRD
ncbi:MAG TPA: substrate-binding domain-containing protein, partial [Burkholderiales bacterium]|nr:substrate-binding domain-containing protein [Burkholderiales bacterium]